MLFGGAQWEFNKSMLRFNCWSKAAQFRPVNHHPQNGHSFGRGRIHRKDNGQFPWLASHSAFALLHEGPRQGCRQGRSDQSISGGAIGLMEHADPDQFNFYQFVNWKLTMLWVLGFLFRYFFLLPMRLIIFSVLLITVVFGTSTVFGTAVIGIIPKGRLKQWMNEKLMLVCMRIASRAFSALIYFHDTENKAKSGAICVANNTSPIDVMILGTDAVYALIGQCHSGFLGAIQRALSRASSNIWFGRSEAKDRSLVARRLHEHVQDPNKLPMLIFPEGTCINNTSVMMFKKECFEVDATIHPIAMKYDSRFGDAFWNSSEQSYFENMLQMMTS